MRTVVITGVSGFIGRYVAHEFKEHGWAVVGVDGSSPENAPSASVSSYYSLRLPDKALAGILEKHRPDAFIQCAGRASVAQSMSDPYSDFYASTVLTFETLNTLRQHAPGCRFIFPSSAAVYGNPATLPVTELQSPAPISPYGYHKWQSEQLCTEFARIYGLPTASVRIFSAYGQGLRRQVLWDMCYKTLVNKALKLRGTGHESRDFIHAKDIARAFVTIAEKADMHGEVYNLASGRESRIQELASIVLAALKSDLTPEFDGVNAPGDPLNWRADITRLSRLGFKPAIRLEDGVRAYAEWCRMELDSRL